jgi:hypothetical protein
MISCISLDRFTGKPLQVFQYFVGALCPLEWLRVGIVRFNELVNSCLEVLHAVMRAAFDLSLAQKCKPAFDLVDPGTVCGSEMQVIARVTQ